jgi:hypothetical protein
VENSTELGLVIIPVSSVYNTNIAFLDIVMGRSFINNKMFPTSITVIIGIYVYYNSLVSLCKVGFNQGFKSPYSSILL